MKIKWLLDTARCLQNPPRRGHNVDLDEGRAAEGQPEQVRKNKGLNFAPFHSGTASFKKPLKRFGAFSSPALLHSLGVTSNKFDRNESKLNRLSNQK